MEKEYVRIQWENRPSIATPLGQSNLNKMDYQINKNEDTLITFDTTKANQSDLLQTIRTLTYDTETGIFVFTFWNGSTYSVDLNIEKIPVTFSMDEYGVITMTTADGTTYTCDIGALIKLYTFVDGDEIDFVTTTDAGGNKTITASIKDGSIVGSKLQPNFLADCQAAKAQAELAATSASSDASDAELSSEDSEAWAVGERNGQPVPSTDPAYENNAKWWAQHGTGSSFAGLSDTNFTNLQNGQIAKYNITTQKWENTEDEGGLLPHFKITSEAGSTVTVVLPDGVTTITPTQTSSGIWQCDVPAYGVYTVHAVINGDDAVRTVTVDTVKEYVIHDEHYSYTLNVYAPTGSSIIVTDGGDETYTGTGAGSTAVVFALHQASTTYTIEVTYDGLERDTTITSSATTGGSGSKTIEFGTINLTLDEDLIGETIVMTNGTATKSKVADSTSMVFYPNATGNWTISCQYDGETYYSEPNPVVVSSLSTAVSAEISLVHIPEGATVTPTDDIQTWLACANITDKSYTTLAEVLADRETFETLIADSNACDYMARSTTWALAEGSVPTMTSSTTPTGYVASGSHERTGIEPYYQAFDDNYTNSWSAGTTALGVGEYIDIELPEAICVSKIMLYHYTDPTYFRTATWELFGSNDGTNWTSIKNDIVANQANTKQYYFIGSTTPYKHFRMKDIQGANYNDQIAFITELQLYSADITRNQDAMALIGKYDYCSNALLGNATWAEAIANSDYLNSIVQPLVPIMTSNTTPSGTVTASSAVGSSKTGDTYVPQNDYYDVFDGNNSSVVGHRGENTSNWWVAYEFSEEVLVNSFSMSAYTFNNAGTFTVYIQYLDTTETWQNMGTTFTVVASNTYTFKLTSFVKAKKFRIYSPTLKASGHALYVRTAQFYGRASSNVSNTNGIIHTAMGNETVYCVETGDTFTATDGIATVDFSDFDEGVYTFGSTTAKNPNDLTEDFKKRFRITKSPYGGTTERYLLPDTIDTLYWWGYESDNFEDATNANGWSRTQYTLRGMTHNTNDILSYPQAGYYISAIGTKNQVSASKFHAISTGVTMVGGEYGDMRTTPTKAIDTPSSRVSLDSTTMAHFEESVSISGYTCITSWSDAQIRVYAFWYE